MQAYEDLRKGERGAWVSIGAYLGLSTFKLIGGYAFSSSALLADGFNNLTDIVASVAVLVGLRISRKPPDAEHAYGHFRAETVAALLASFIMAVVGIQVIVEAFRSGFAGDKAAPGLASAWIALACAAVMLTVYRYNSRLAKRIDSGALQASAKDNLSDAVVSIGAAVGIFGARLGLPWMDTVAAIAVGGVILKTAWEIFSDSTYRLTDGFDESRLDALRETIAGTPGVGSIRDVKGRVHGSQVLIDVVVGVDGSITVQAGHDISDEIERRLREQHKVGNIHVHVEPKT